MKVIFIAAHAGDQLGSGMNRSWGGTRTNGMK